MFGGSRGRVKVNPLTFLYGARSHVNRTTPRPEGDKPLALIENKVLALISLQLDMEGVTALVGAVLEDFLG
jgi:hypothetical protein